MTKKIKPVWRAFFVMSYIAVFTLCEVLSTPAFALGIQLSDEELDAVYAEGFNVTFDVSPAKPSTLFNKASSNISSYGKPGSKNTVSTTPSKPDLPSNPNTVRMSSPSNSNILMVNDRSQQFLSSLVNINAAGSVVPVLMNLVINNNSVITNATNTNSLILQNFYNIVVPAEAVSILPTIPNPTPNIEIPKLIPEPYLPGPIMQNTPVAQTSPINGSMQPIIPGPLDAAPTLSFNDSNTNLSAAAPATNEPVSESATTPANVESTILTQPSVEFQPATNEPEPIAAAAPSSNTQIATTDAQPFTFTEIFDAPNSTAPSNAEAEVQPLNPDPSGAQNFTDPIPASIQEPTNPQLPVMIFSATEGFPDTSGSDMGNEAISDNLIADGIISSPELTINISQAADSSLNLVVVGQQAQQYLSSLVNVNSAGSVVPVLVNFVININSEVDQLANSNNLRMENNYRFQIR